MRIATWNVNSVKARLPRLLSWLDQRQPDVLLVQETKVTDDTWPAAELATQGYQSVHHGTGRWNGVGILSRVGLDEITLGLPGQPSFEEAAEARAIGASCGGLRLWSIYVPNGRKVGSEHFRYKIEFLRALREQCLAELAALGPGKPFGLLGDFNVAPSDQDVWDIHAFLGHTHVTPEERSAVTDIQQDAALTDLLPRASADPQDKRPAYTFWEMRMLGFQKGRGMRIDLALVNHSLGERVEQVWVDRDARKGEGPSDHAPLVLDLTG
ncbi:MAG TPA: exodeoxyribonuclease III [Jatrophihabitans sp.]|nr:exodeoxyribonuclease III [Jatrophihabitans sp.]